MFDERVLKILLAISLFALAMTGCERKRSLDFLEDGDIVVKREKTERTSFEIFRIETRDGRADGVSIFKAATLPEDFYKCDNDPPQNGDNCTCVTGTSIFGMSLDCFDLLIDCKPGEFNGSSGSCDNWEPIPPAP